MIESNVSVSMTEDMFVLNMEVEGVFVLVRVLLCDLLLIVRGVGLSERSLVSS